MEEGSNGEEPTSWDELYNINLMPSELFVKFRKEIEGFRVGLNLEVLFSFLLCLTSFQFSYFLGLFFFKFNLFSQNYCMECDYSTGNSQITLDNIKLCCLLCFFAQLILKLKLKFKLWKKFTFYWKKIWKNSVHIFLHC